MIAIFYFLVMTFLKFYWWIVIANVIISWLIAFNVLNTNNAFIYNVLDFNSVTSCLSSSLRSAAAFFPSIKIIIYN